MHGPQTDRSLLERIEALELANRQLAARCHRWNRVGLSLAGGLALMLIGGAAIQSHSTIEGSEFVLRDKNNRMRASLALRPDGTPGLGLFDESGKVRLSLELSPVGAPGVNLLGATGSLGAAVAIRPDGTPGIGLFDNRGSVRTSLDVGADGTSGISIFDPAGAIRAALALRPDGTPGIGLFTPEGEVVESPPMTKPQPDEPAAGPRL